MRKTKQDGFPLLISAVYGMGILLWICFVVIRSGGFSDDFADAHAGFQGQLWACLENVDSKKDGFWR